MDPQEEPVKSLVLQGMDFSFNNRFEEAEQVFDQLIREYPQHPVGYFYKAATVQAEMLDAEDYRQEGQFYATGRAHHSAGRFPAKSREG